jgi:hypothetical protein
MALGWVFVLSIECGGTKFNAVGNKIRLVKDPEVLPT